MSLGVRYQVSTRAWGLGSKAFGFRWLGPRGIRLRVQGSGLMTISHSNLGPETLKTQTPMLGPKNQGHYDYDYDSSSYNYYNYDHCCDCSYGCCLLAALYLLQSLLALSTEGCRF